MRTWAKTCWTQSSFRRRIYLDPVLEKKCNVSLFSSSVPPCCVHIIHSFPLLALNPDKWTQPPSPSQQLRVTHFKARDMNNQTVIFSFSSSCYWPDFMIFSSFPPCFLSSSLSIWMFLLLLNPGRLLICTRSSNRFRIKGRKLTRRTTTESLQSSAGSNEWWKSQCNCKYLLLFVVEWK